MKFTGVLFERVVLEWRVRT